MWRLWFELLSEVLSKLDFLEFWLVGRFLCYNQGALLLSWLITAIVFVAK